MIGIHLRASETGGASGRREAICHIVVAYPVASVATDIFRGFRRGLDRQLRVIDESTTWFGFVDYRQRYGYVHLDGRRIRAEIGLLAAPAPPSTE